MKNATLWVLKTFFQDIHEVIILKRIENANLENSMEFVFRSMAHGEILKLRDSALELAKRCELEMQK